ncbi:MAG TPA: tetratricopeptide repeat protein [Pyrinomonadaceae bacterium]|jgi:TolB-like protein/Flp pilus assembly protein TadD
MKRCPKCNRAESDDSLAFCRADGTRLVSDGGFVSEGAGTLRFDSAPVTGEAGTRILPTGEAPGSPAAPTTVLDVGPASGNTQDLSKPKSRKGLLIAVAAIIAVAAAASAYFYLSRVKTGAAKNSIAVLPFQNAGGDPSMEYLTDGISESLINSLSQLPDVRVLARSTMFRFKGKDADLQAVGKQLGVDTVLTGKVVQVGESLNVQAELVNVSDGSQLWGERYTRKTSDLLAVQEDIAREIVGTLRLKLSGEQREQVTKRYTDNAEAYQLYLKGRFYWNKRTGEGFNEAIDYFRQAIEKDPNYALAYAGLADCYVLRPGRQNQELSKAKEAAAHALAIDPKLAEAHTSLAFAKTLSDRDWDGARAEFEEAIRLNPKYATAHQWHAILLSVLGKPDEALAEINRAIELDPLSLIINTDKGRILYYARRYDEAVGQLQDTLKMDADFGMAHNILGWCYAEKGMYDQAVAEMRKSMELGVSLGGALGRIGYTYARAGKRDEAQKVLAQLEQRSEQSYISPYTLATIYAALGERDKAFSLLQKAVDEGAAGQSFMKVDPVFENLHPDPRFADLLRRIGFPQ